MLAIRDVVGQMPRSVYHRPCPGPESRTPSRSESPRQEVGERKSLTFPPNPLSGPPGWVLSGVSFLPLLLSHHLFIPPPSPSSVPEIQWSLEGGGLRTFFFGENLPPAKHTSCPLSLGTPREGGVVEEEPSTVPDTGSSSPGGEGDQAEGYWVPRGLGQTWKDVGGCYQSRGHPRHGGTA